MTNTHPTDTSEELREAVVRDRAYGNGMKQAIREVWPFVREDDRWWNALATKLKELDERADRFSSEALSATSRARSTHAGEGMVEARIKHMVQRFLGWKLPANFNPDNGISFDPVMNKGHAFESRREPVGTNLLSADQASEMVRYMVEGIADAPTSRIILERIRGNAVAALECTKSARASSNTRRYIQQVIDGIDVELAVSAQSPTPREKP